MSLPNDQHIQQLPVQLANQIAAGEVVERPASVVKELLENSLDAGATRVDIDIEQGGLQSIRIQDDGAGMFEQDLPLALSRHATSKVSSLFDLEHLVSLGFRGEALPSIASVSRLQIITRRHDASQASRIEVSETGEISEVHPAAHPLGTTVVVDDLFCNAPARRRFLKAAKTEFAHIQDVVQRIALARADVTIQLRHNNRQVIKVTAAQDEATNKKRLARIFGQDFVESAYKVADEADGLRVTGFVAPASLHRAQTDRQYVYINGRMIKDRVLSHAIRQAYGEQLPEGRFASFCIYLEIDPVLVDVNVHPTKHEVRFRDGRNVHDFLFSTLQRALQGQPAANIHNNAVVESVIASTPPVSEVRERATVYSMPLCDVASSNMEHPFGQVLSVLAGRFLFCKKAPEHWLIDAQKLLQQVYLHRLQNEYSQQGIVSRPLLLPERLTLNEGQAILIEQQLELIEQLGFEITIIGDASALLRRAPVVLQQAESSSLGVALLALLQDDELSQAKIESSLLLLARAAALSTSIPEGSQALQTWLAKLLDSVKLEWSSDWLLSLEASQLEQLFSE